MPESESTSRILVAGCALVLAAVLPAFAAPADPCRELSVAKGIWDVNLDREFELLERIRRTEEDLESARQRASRFVAPQSVDDARQARKSADGELSVVERRLSATRKQIGKLAADLAALGDPQSLQALRDQRKAVYDSAKAAAKGVESRMANDMSLEAGALGEIDKKLDEWAGPEAKRQLIADPKRIHAKSFRGDPGSHLYEAIAECESSDKCTLEGWESSFVRAESKRLNTAIDDARATIARLLADRVNAEEIKERREKALEPGLPESDRKLLAARDAAERALEKVEEDLRRARALERQHRDGVAAEQKLVQELSEARKEVDRQQKRLDAALAGVSDPRDEVRRLEAELARLRSEVADAQHLQAEAKKRIATLELEVAELGSRIESSIDEARRELGVAGKRNRAGDSEACVAALARAWQRLDEASLELGASSCPNLGRLRGRVDKGRAVVERASCDGRRVGERLVEVPSVTGSQVDEAIRRLEGMGLAGTVVPGEPTSEPESIGLVVGQNRSHKEKVAIGTVIELVVLTDGLALDHGDPDAVDLPGGVAPRLVDTDFDGRVPNWAGGQGEVGTRDVDRVEDPCRGPRPDYVAALTRVEAAAREGDVAAVTAAAATLPRGCPGDGEWMRTLAQAIRRDRRRAADRNTGGVKAAENRARADHAANIGGMLSTLETLVEMQRRAATGAAGAASGGWGAGGGRSRESNGESSAGGCIFNIDPSVRAIGGQKGVRWYVMSTAGPPRTVTVMPVPDGRPAPAGAGRPYESLAAAERAGRGLCH